MQYEKTIHLEVAGTLAKFIPPSERYNLFSLKVTGFINREDVENVLDEMCTSEGEFEGDPEDDIWVADIEHSPRLRYLDLSESQFVGGNTFPYMGWYPLLEYIAFPQEIEYTSEKYNSGFEDASQLKTVVLPDGIKTIDGFSGCEKLSNINIPASLEKIESLAFAYCRKLTSFPIPRKVNYIGGDAFAQCGITSFQVDPDNPYFTTVDGVIFSKDLKTLVAFPPAYPSKHYNIPEGTETIGKGAFENCNLDTIHIPDTVMKIDAWAFECSGLREVYIPDSVTEIGELCFPGSSNLESIRLPNNIHTLEAQIFSGCNNLKEVDIPASVKKMDVTNIVWSESLEHLYLHNGLEEITNDVLCLYKPLKYKEFYLPKTLRSFPGWLFYNCHDLKDFNLDPENPYMQSVNGAIYSKDMKKLLAVPDCLRKTFSVATGVKEIGDYVFANFSQLEEVTLPDSIECIGHRAFNWCHSLKEICLPANLKRLDFRAFEDCKSLERIVCLAPKPPLLTGSNPHWHFLNDCKNVTVVILRDSLPLYQADEGWKQVKLIPIED